MFISLFIIVGIIFMITGLIQSKQECLPPIIEYRYIPRTFKEEQKNPSKVSDIFGDLFAQPSAWVGSFGNYNPSNKKEINADFISQG